MKWLYLIAGIVSGLMLATSNMILFNWLALMWGVFACVKLANYVFDREEKKHA